MKDKGVTVGALLKKGSQPLMLNLNVMTCF